MFTRLGAGYNKCRPVRLWNGLSNVSLLLQATTRCSRGYSPERLTSAKCAGGSRPSANGPPLVRESHSAANNHPKTASRQRPSKVLVIPAPPCAPTLLVAP